MKKILLLMAIILPFVLTSCGDDKDEPSNLEKQLIGAWSANNDLSETVIFTFNADHTGTHDIYSPLLTHILNESFTWKLEGNILKLTYETKSMQAKISIKGDILYITDDGETFELHRAKG